MVFLTFVTFAFTATVAYAGPNDGSKAPSLPSSPLSNREKAIHALNRLGYGPRPGDVERLTASGSAGIAKWVWQQMQPEVIDDHLTDQKLQEFPTLLLSSEAMIEKYPTPKSVAEKQGIDKEKFKNDKELKKEIRQEIGQEHLPERIIEELQEAKLVRATESNRQLLERLDDFWFNHFNVDSRKGNLKFMTTVYERETIRPNMYGKFSDLLKATAHSPAMMVYLDNAVSQSPLEYKQGQPPKPRNKGLNENYAREILELHTLGVDGGYTQKDVTELARVLTGWSVADKQISPEFAYKDRVHDKGRKVVLGHVFNENRAQDEGDEALLLIARHPATAHHIAFELAQTFVSDDPPPALVKKLAQVFTESDGDLTRVYRELFFSKEFWSKEAQRSKIKTPLHLFASSVRALGGELDHQSEGPKLLKKLGEELYTCAPPTGYKDTSESWVGPGSMVERLNMALALSAQEISGVLIQLPKFSTAPLTTKGLVQILSHTLLYLDLAPTTLEVALNELGTNSPQMSSGEPRPLINAKATGLILGSPEFQRH